MTATAPRRIRQQLDGPRAPHLVEPLVATAYHEAGHAVAGVVLRHNVARVFVHPTDDRTGAVAYRPRREYPRPAGDPEDPAAWAALAHWEAREARRETVALRRLRRHLVVVLAGPLAQMRVDASVHWTSDADAWHDREQATTCALRLAPQGREAQFVAAAEAEANALLDTHWPAVERVARALVARRRLSGRALRRIARTADVAA